MDIRYFHEGKNEVQNSFIGFLGIKTLDSKSMAYTTDDFSTKADLNPDKSVEFGFDGFLTMSGNEGGVQAYLIRSHSAMLERVINVLPSTTSDAVKTTQPIKRIIQLFRSHCDDPVCITDEV